MGRLFTSAPCTGVVFGETMASTSVTLGKYSLGIGDRFGLEAPAQLRALQMALEKGVEVTPVWNKSNREHLIVGSDPASTRKAADATSATVEANFQKPFGAEWPGPLKVQFSATLSAKVMEGLLRRELGFDGLLVTDAMDMAGVVDRFGAAEAVARVIGEQAAFDGPLRVLLQPCVDRGLHDEAVRGPVDAGQGDRGRTSPRC